MSFDVGTGANPMLREHAEETDEPDFYSSTREPYFRAGVRPNKFIWRGGVRTGKVTGTLSKTVEGAVYDIMKHFGDVGSAVAHCLSTGSFISGGERCLAWLDSPAALNCCLRIA